MTTTPSTIDEMLADILTKAKHKEAPAEAPEDEKDPAKLKQRKPPSKGPCRRCGASLPLNRLMLCYRCWVVTELEKRGWKDGEPHPDACDCEGLGGHGRLSEGN